MPRSSIWIVFAVFAVITGSAQAQPPPSIELDGRVRDAAGLALPGVTVTARDAAGAVVATTQTERDGQFRLAVASQPVQVTFQLSGFRTVTRDLPAPASRPLEIVLQLAGFTDEVTVTAARDARTLAAVPSSVSVVSGAVLEHAPGVNLVETLKFVPGVAAGDVSGVDDLRIAIRGSGIRSSFGSRGVILMADGVPITEPDGQTPHFDGQIDLAHAERVEIVKGPASAMYGGAALGGVVNVITRVPSRQPRATVRAEGGSFEFGKAHAAGSGGFGPLVLSGTVGYTHLDGFREHNTLANWAGTARADWSNDRSRLSVTLLGTDASLDLPGTLNREQFERDPSQVRPIYVTNDWGRENTLIRFGGRYERQVGEDQTLELDSFGQTRDLFHPIFVVIDQDAVRYVGHARYRLARGRHALAVGVDADTQTVADRWFVNDGGQPRFQIRDDDNLVTNFGFYLQDEIALGGRATLTAGVRADRIRYDLQDRLPGDGDASDERTFSRVSPKLGFTARVHDDLVAYGNVATGFEAPTLGEVRLTSGFNDIVRPQKAVSLEGGLRGGRGVVSFDLAVYRMQVDDEILPQTIDNVTIFRNVAEATHTGVETSVRVQPVPGVTVEAGYAYSRFVLENFGVFSGNRLPGIPAQMGSIRTSYASPAGFDGSVALVFAGDAFVNDANTETVPAYGVVSANLGYRISRVRTFLRLENIGDMQYTNRPQVNDSGGFFFYPAPGRSAAAGVEVRW